jgi:hypothetical protein
MNSRCRVSDHFLKNPDGKKAADVLLIEILPNGPVSVLHKTSHSHHVHPMLLIAMLPSWTPAQPCHQQLCCDSVEDASRRHARSVRVSSPRWIPTVRRYIMHAMSKVHGRPTASVTLDSNLENKPGEVGLPGGPDTIQTLSIDNLGRICVSLLKLRLHWPKISSHATSQNCLCVPSNTHTSLGMSHSIL